MLVTRSNFGDVIAELQNHKRLALDTETNGLSAYKGNRLFSIIVASAETAWYFNFNAYEGVGSDAWLQREHKEALQADLFSRPDITWLLHNAKFDLHMLGVENLSLSGCVYCTYAHGRLLHNDLRSYGLDFLAARWLGENKSDAVKEYADEHKLFDVVMKGRQKRKNYHFWRVPLPVIQEYAEKDGLLTFKLADFLEEKIRLLDDKYRSPSQPPLMQVSDNESALTKVLYEMERTGVQLDKAYCESALTAERQNYMRAAEQFKELTGFDYEDSPTCIAKAFKQLGVEAPVGKNGTRVLTNKAVLAQVKHPVADCIQAWRSAHKKAVTYYANFLAMCDEHGRVHPDFHQGGTKTGRLSCRDPNLQNLERPDEDDEEAKDSYTVRRAFVPTEGFCFFAPDYDQIEYRLMLEYAQEESIIKLVLDGLDVHSATAQMLGVGRHLAKTINFMLIYGGGIDKLAAMTKMTWEEAKAARNDYFKKLPRIAALIERIREVAADRLWTRNWFGRRYTFAFPDMTYTTAPNWLIQGGCADVLKIALIRCHEYLRARRARSRAVLNVHDEIVFELHRSELELAPKLVDIMENVYPSKFLKLTAGPAYSWRSLADKIDGLPTEVVNGVA